MQMPEKFGLEYAQLSDIGLRRGNNQDAVAIATAANEENWRGRGHLFMVADGMGAHAAGELASTMAAEIVPQTYRKLLGMPPHAAIRQAFQEANQRIHERGQANPEFRGMGTTASLLLLLPEGALIAHVGDSRVYRLRGETLEQLSFDHSLVWETMASARLPADQAPPMIPKNIITRSLGPNPKVQVDIEGPFPVESGDTFLLCSDGLSGPVDDDELGSLLRCLTPEEVVRTLVDLANLRGGPDNITVIVARVGAEPPDGGVAPAAARATNGSSIGRRRLTAVIWAVLLLFVVLGIVFSYLGRTSLALASGVMAVAAAAAALADRMAGNASEGPSTSEERFGSGPYTSTNCPVRAEFVDRLARIVRELREAAVEEHWAVDWQRFNAYDQEAVANANDGKFVDAARCFSHAISFMMQQLRAQKARHDDENVGRDEG